MAHNLLTSKDVEIVYLRHQLVAADDLARRLEPEVEHLRRENRRLEAEVEVLEAEVDDLRDRLDRDD